MGASVRRREPSRPDLRGSEAGRAPANVRGRRFTTRNAWLTLLALVSAPSAFKTGDKIIIVAWIAQTFLQLVLLPIIIVGQNVQAAAADARAQATYDDAAAVLDEAKQIQQHLEAQDAELERLVATVCAPNAT